MRLVVGVVALAALSLLIPAAPDYDGWAYLQWGREVMRLELDTVDGPAFKPLPVAVCALLSGIGPDAWLLVVRIGALAAVALAWRLSWAAGAGVLLTGGFLFHAGVGNAEPLVVAFALGAWQRHRAGHPGQAFALGCAAALVRVEVWPFLLAYALWPPNRPRVGIFPTLGGFALVVAAWFLPELAGSGELLRSGDRALSANPGAPALADRPFIASLEDAAALLPLPLALAAIRGPKVALTAGLAWCLLVALMAEAGFSGEARYALPGIAAIAVAAGAARIPKPLLAILLIATALLSLSEIRATGERLDSTGELAADLEQAIEKAGGRDALLACGRPAAGRYRGTLLAYALDVPKRTIRADGEPGDVTFRSRLAHEHALSPAPAGRLLVAHGRWRIETSCDLSAGR